MASTAVERTTTVGLWRDLWAHVLNLRAENEALRRRLGLPEVRYDLHVKRRLPEPLEGDGGWYIAQPTRAADGQCRVCGSPVPPSKGRPRVYCGRRCALKAAAHRATRVG